MPTLTCTVEDGKIIVELPDDVDANTPFTLEITGISNPNKGTTSSGVSITTKDSSGSTLDFVSNAIPSITSTQAAPAFDLTLLTTTSTAL
mmetsp:Transcript_13854/g.11837  ORF Transcript_13854/g.11837 Transcript_13854/m.11837 type:complete len:90 (+) Transcript_13854:7609-7878(+)